MIIKEKGKDIKVILKPLKDPSIKDYYEIKAFNRENKEMGYVHFSIKDDFIWLWQIVAYSKYQNNGVGQALLDTMEYFCATQTNCNKIQGKFNPDNQYAEKFYLKNGYDMPIKNYCVMINKDLTKNIKSEIIKKVEGKFQTPFNLEGQNEDLSM